MWRCAHGRLAAIAVVLAGGLSGCASTPKPVEDDDDHDTSRMHCGGAVPSLSRETLAPLIEKEVQKSCGPGAVSGERFGEIRVVGRLARDGDPVFETEGGEDLSDDDRRCVVQAAHRALPRNPYRSHDDAWYAGVGGFTLDIALGKAPPLLPPTSELFDRWLAAARGGPARKKFEARLPAEVTLTDDGCLSFPFPLAPAIDARRERWLADVGAPFDDFWRYGLLNDLLPEGKLARRAYLLGRPMMLVNLVAPPDRSREQFCLMPFDERVRRELQARVDQRGSCWVGDLREVLVHPRTDFPADRRFSAVAVGGGHACALDDKGAPVCCGSRIAGELPAGPFTTVAAGSDYDCGLTRDGSIQCWGQSPPAGGAEIPGPYARVSIGGREMCASRRDTGALECWSFNQPTVVTALRERIRDVRVLEHDVCALLEDGQMLCRGDGDTFMEWPRLGGRFNAFAATKSNVCGVTGADDLIKCWGDWSAWMLRDGKRYLPASAARDAARAGDVALTSSDGCVLRGTGKIACWGAPATRRWDGAYRAIASNSDRMCAVTADGRVECDREWPPAAK